MNQYPQAQYGPHPSFVNNLNSTADKLTGSPIRRCTAEHLQALCSITAELECQLGIGAPSVGSKGSTDANTLNEQIEAMNDLMSDLSDRLVRVRSEVGLLKTGLGA